MGNFRDEPMPGDPLGLTVEQRLTSNESERYGELMANLTMACPLCRAYECLPGCLTRLRVPWLFGD